MKKIFFLTMLLFNAAIIAQKITPKIHSNEQTFDIGDISQNEIIIHNFYIKNIGSADLIIKDVKSSCECTVVQPVKRKLHPGDSVKVTAKFNTADKIGYQRHHVYIFSNDPRNPEYRLTLIGNVVLTKDEEAALPTINVPYTLYDFGDVQQGEILKHSIEIKNTGKGLLKIKKIKTGCGSLKLSLKKKRLKYKETGNLRLKFNTKNLIGQQSCIVTIRSNDPRVRVAIITIKANVVK